MVAVGWARLGGNMLLLRLGTLVVWCLREHVRKMGVERVSRGISVVAIS